jgi:superfamily II DNA helicase RecQ
VPAFYVFSDAVLRLVAEACPQDVAGLATIPGIGPKKLARHGDALLAVTRRGR